MNQILSSITYTSDLNWYGYDVLSVTVSDDHHTTPYSYASMVNITVHGTACRPFSASLNFDTAQTESRKAVERAAPSLCLVQSAPVPSTLSIRPHAQCRMGMGGSSGSMRSVDHARFAI